MSELPERVRSDFLTSGNWYWYAANVYLVEEGRRDDHDVFVLTPADLDKPDRPACVKVIQYAENGCESLVGLRTNGDLIGEMAALRGIPRGAAVRTAVPTGAYRFTRDKFREFLKHNPAGNTAVIATLINRLAWSNERRLENAAYPVLVRLARVILEIARQHGRPTDLGLKIDTADTTGMGGTRGSQRTSYSGRFQSAE